MRKPDWHSALSLYLKTQARRNFVIGSHDNFTFTAGCIGAMTGTDPARGLRGKYKTDGAAIKLFHDLGYADHIEYLSHGRATIPVSFAQTGDMGILGPQRVAGIFTAGRVLVMTDQLQYVPVDQVTTAYRVT